MPKHVTLLVAGLIGFATLGCGEAAIQRTAPQSEERFAREYFQALRDSGVVAAIARTKPATAGLPRLAPMLDSLGILLRSNGGDSLVLKKWQVEYKSGKPKATEIVFATARNTPPVQMGVWIEEEHGRLLVETIYYGAPKR